MNRSGIKRLADTISAAGSMTLFMLFAVCCLVIISVAVSAYGRIDEGYENTFSCAAAVRYITNKIRAGDEVHVISEDRLLLENPGYSTVIYHKNGMIYERVFAPGQTPVYEGGEEMFGTDEFTLTVKDGIITITAGSGGNSFSGCCRGGGEG